MRIVLLPMLPTHQTVPRWFIWIIYLRYYTKLHRTAQANIEINSFSIIARPKLNALWNCIFPSLLLALVKWIWRAHSATTIYLFFADIYWALKRKSTGECCVAVREKIQSKIGKLKNIKIIWWTRAHSSRATILKSTRFLCCCSLVLRTGTKSKNFCD